MTEVSWKDAGDFLNRAVQRTELASISYRIHYWGATRGLWPNHLHQHSFFEICYCTAGSGLYTDQGREHRIEEGTMFCSRPHVLHQITPDTTQPMDLLYVAFELEGGTEAQQQCFRELERTQRYFLHGMSSSPSAHLWQGLIAQAALGYGQQEQLIETMTHALLSSFAELFSEPVAAEGRRRPPTSSALTRQVELYIRDNLSMPLRLEDIAQHVHLSSRQLSRLFHAEREETIFTYVRRERVRFAQRLLRETSLPIAETAQQAGFQNVHYFTRAFSEISGMPPARYRKKV